MNNPLDIPVGKVQEQPTPDVKPEAPGLINTQIIEEAELHAIAHSLGVDKLSEMKAHQDRLKRVYEWATLRGAKSLTDIVAEIQSLRSRVGSPNIYNLSVYAGLELERMTLDQKMRKFEK